MPGKGLIIVVSGPSGVGKTSLTERLRKNDPRLALSVSTTTRPPRGSEVEGVQYHFVEREEFERLVRAGEMVEHAELYGNLYGTQRADLEAARRDGRDVLLEIDGCGAEQVKRAFPEAVLIFVVPPDMEELRRRLAVRGTDAPDVMDRRLDNAKRELAWIRCFDYVVVNSDLDQAADDLAAIVGYARVEAVTGSPGFPDRVMAMRLDQVLPGLDLPIGARDGGAA